MSSLKFVQLCTLLFGKVPHGTVKRFNKPYKIVHNKVIILGWDYTEHGIEQFVSIVRLCMLQNNQMFLKIFYMCAHVSYVHVFL